MKPKFAALAIVASLMAAPALADTHLLGGQSPMVTRMAPAPDCGQQTETRVENGVAMTRTAPASCEAGPSADTARTIIHVETRVIVEAPRTLSAFGERRFGVRANSFGVPKPRRF